VTDGNCTAAVALQQQEVGISLTTVMLVNQKIGRKGRKIIPQSYCIHVYMAHLNACPSLIRLVYPAAAQISVSCSSTNYLPVLCQSFSL